MMHVYMQYGAKFSTLRVCGLILWIPPYNFLKFRGKRNFKRDTPPKKTVFDFYGCPVVRDDYKISQIIKSLQKHAWKLSDTTDNQIL